MSRVEDLIASYQRFAKLPWPGGLAPAQRVWMAVYAPDDERRLRLHIQEFETASCAAGHDWALVDITSSFEEWMAAHEYRDAYFDNPKLIRPELVGFLDSLVAQVRKHLEKLSGPNTIVGLLGAGNLFGLGEQVKVSALVDRIEDAITGRLLVFFPGEVELNNYRLLNGRDGWNYRNWSGRRSVINGARASRGVPRRA